MIRFVSHFNGTIFPFYDGCKDFSNEPFDVS